jgi:hypothetical protein
MSVAREAFQQETQRLQAVPDRPRRAPLLALAGRLAARLVVALPRLRTAALAVGGFGCLVAAAWTVAVPLGLAAAGCALLLLEYLTGDESRRRWEGVVHLGVPHS